MRARMRLWRLEMAKRLRRLARVRRRSSFKQPKAAIAGGCGAADRSSARNIAQLACLTLSGRPGRYEVVTFRPMSSLSMSRHSGVIVLVR